MADDYSLPQSPMEISGYDFSGLDSDSDSDANSHSNLVSQFLASISKLSSREDWFFWESQILTFLEFARFKHLLGRDKQEPTLAAGESEIHLKRRIARWEIRQRQACACVESRLGRNGLRLSRVKERRLHVLMEFLRDHYKPDRNDLPRLFREYSSLELADCSDVGDYASKLMDLHRCIESIDPSCKIGYPLLTIRFLNGLGPDYSTFAVHFPFNNNLLPERDPESSETRGGQTRDKSSFDKAISAARTLEWNMKECEAREEQSRQIQANTRNRGQRRKRARERGRALTRRGRV